MCVYMPVHVCVCSRGAFFFLILDMIFVVDSAIFVSMSGFRGKINNNVRNKTNQKINQMNNEEAKMMNQDYFCWCTCRKRHFSMVAMSIRIIKC